MDERLYTKEFIGGLPEFEQGGANPWVAALCKSGIPAMEDLVRRMERSWRRPDVPMGMRRNLQKWLQSEVESKFLGFFFEFLLWGECRRRGWGVEYEPKGSEGPDFLVKSEGGHFYLQAYVADDPEYCRERREWVHKAAREGIRIEGENWRGVLRPRYYWNDPRGMEDETVGPKVLGTLNLYPRGRGLEVEGSQRCSSAGDQQRDEGRPKPGDRICIPSVERRGRRLRDSILKKAREARWLGQPYVVAVCYGGNRLQGFFRDVGWILFEGSLWRAQHISALILWSMARREDKVLFRFDMLKNPSARWPVPGWVWPEGTDHVGVPFWDGGFGKDGEGLDQAPSPAKGI